MPSITFWAGVGGGTEQYRCRTPGEALRRQGWTVEYVAGPHTPIDSDIIVFSRVLARWMPELIDELRHRTRATLVYDIDDWYDDIPGYNPAAQHVGPAEIRVLHDTMRRCDLITCSTDELADGYKHLAPTVVLPNYLNPDIWPATPVRPFREQIHVGWLGHYQARAADIDLLRPWLPGWLDDHPEVTFVSIGSRELLVDLGIRGFASSPTLVGGRELRPYTHLPKLLAHLDIGLVPLADNRFNRAKSWCKGLEYNAAGAAAVASPSREYRKYIQPGVNGFLVRHGDWPAAVNRALRQLPALQQGARQVAAGMVIDDHIGRWIDAYEQASVLV